MHEILVADWWTDYCGDAAGNLDPSSVNRALLSEHLVVGAGIAAVDLRDRVQRSVEPLPLPFDLPLQLAQLVEFIHSPPLRMFPFCSNFATSL